MPQEGFLAQHENSGKRPVPGPELSAGKTGFALDHHVGSPSKKIRDYCSLTSGWVGSVVSCERSVGAKVCVDDRDKRHKNSPKIKYLNMFLLTTQCKKDDVYIHRFIFIFWLANWLESVSVGVCL